MPQQVFAILQITPDFQRQKEIGACIDTVPGVRFMGGSTEGIMTVEMDRKNIPDVRRKLPDEFKKCPIISWAQHQKTISSKRRHQNR